MNAAEITDKLGLHSLRQRAWVCQSEIRTSQRRANTVPSTSSPLAPHPVTVCMRVSNG
jgi:hypothetical protein